jgi:hypothetical protein
MADLNPSDGATVDVDEFDVRTAASIPGRPTTLDQVLVTACVCGADARLRDLALWIRDAYHEYPRSKETSTGSTGGSHGTRNATDGREKSPGTSTPI